MAALLRAYMFRGLLLLMAASGSSSTPAVKSLGASPKKLVLVADRQQRGKSVPPTGVQATLVAPPPSPALQPCAANLAKAAHDEFDKLDLNKDGKIDREELMAHLAGGGTLAVPVPAPAPGPAHFHGGGGLLPIPIPMPAPAPGPAPGPTSEGLPYTDKIPPSLPKDIPEPPPPPRPPPSEPAPPVLPPMEGQLVVAPPSSKSVAAKNVATQMISQVPGLAAQLDEPVPGLDLDGTDPLQEPGTPPPMPMPLRPPPLPVVAEYAMENPVPPDPALMTPSPREMSEHISEIKHFLGPGAGPEEEPKSADMSLAAIRGPPALPEFVATAPMSEVFLQRLRTVRSIISRALHGSLAPVEPPGKLKSLPPGPPCLGKDGLQLGPSTTIPVTAGGIAIERPNLPVFLPSKAPIYEGTLQAYTEPPPAASAPAPATVADAPAVAARVDFHDHSKVYVSASAITQEDAAKAVAASYLYK